MSGHGQVAASAGHPSRSSFVTFSVPLSDVPDAPALDVRVSSKVLVSVPDAPVEVNVSTAPAPLALPPDV